MCSSDLGEAWAYIGNTLVTRKRRFADGIAALELATTLCADDAAVWYTLGWCREYAANALARPKGGKVQAAALLPVITLQALLLAALLLFVRRSSGRFLSALA